MFFLTIICALILVISAEQTQEELGDNFEEQKQDESAVSYVLPENIVGCVPPGEPISSEESNMVFREPEPSDFKKCRLYSKKFVDKSLLLNDIIANNQPVILIARPRHWGKSINVDMMRRFFEIEVTKKGIRKNERYQKNKKLFLGGRFKLNDGRQKILKPLDIANFTNITSLYQGQLPVIVLNMSCVQGKTAETIKQSVIHALRREYRRHWYLLNFLKNNITELEGEVYSDRFERFASGIIRRGELENSIQFLMHMLYKYYQKKVIVLVDDYDFIVGVAHKKLFVKNWLQYDEVTKFSTQMYLKAFQHNPHLEKAVIMGFLPIPPKLFIKGLKSMIN